MHSVAHNLLVLKYWSFVYQGLAGKFSTGLSYVRNLTGALKSGSQIQWQLLLEHRFPLGSNEAHMLYT